MSERVPTLSEVLADAIAQGAAALRVSLPGEIVSFDAAEQTAQVRPLLSESHLKDGVEVELSLEILNSVPVQFAGGGGFSETWPVKAGDPCLLIFSDRSIDQWFARGGAVEPKDSRRHHLSDGVAILGARSGPGALADFDGDRAVWGNKGPRIAADGSKIHLGVDHLASGGQSVIRGDDFKTDLESLLTSIGNSATQQAAAFTALASAAGAPPLTPLATAFTTLAQALASVPVAIGQFKTKFPLDLSDKVKIP